MNATLVTQRRRLVPMVIVMALAAHGAALGQVTIDPVVRAGDSVPNRDDPFVFQGGTDMQLPVMNASGDVVFRARSASSDDFNVGKAIGIYVRRPGEGIEVLVDNLVDNAGTPGFAVPERSSNAFFTDFSTPLINDVGDVVFSATFVQSSGVRAGIYATTTTGGGLTKVADSFDLMPGAGGVTFTRFTLSSFQDLGGLALNNAGQIAFFGVHDPSIGSDITGIFGSTVGGGAIAQLADNTITPMGVPFGTPLPFIAITPKISLNDAGQVAFNGQIKLTSGATRGGVFRVPVTGGTSPVSMAFQFQVAPDAGGATFNSPSNQPFSDQDIDTTGRVVFISRLSTGSNGLYSTPSPGGGFTRIVATRVGGLDVPGDIMGAEFDEVSIAETNEEGQMGFFAQIRKSGTANNQGIYSADADTSVLGLILDASTNAPGLPDPARVTDFANASAAINENGSMAFAGSGVDDMTNDLLGLYYFSACGGQVVRIVDSTTSMDDLGADFSTPLDDGSLAIHQGFAALSGRYDAINDAEQVVFLAQFDGVGCDVTTNCDFGIYVAQVSGGAGGQIDIDCPADFVLECPADTSTNSLGKAVAVDTCSGAAVPVSFSDAVTPDCGGAETITRTWTADDGAGNMATCDQLIAVDDSTPPALSLSTNAVSVVDIDCSGDETVALPTASASDACGSATVTDDAPATYPAGQTTEVTFTATDDCGNASTDTVDVDVAFGASLEVHVSRFTVGPGSHPGASNEPIVGVDVCAFDRSGGSCADTMCPSSSQQNSQCILDNCSPISCSVTDINGVAFLDAPPGTYQVIAFDPGGIEIPEPLGHVAGAISCEDAKVVRLRQIERNDGKRLAGRITRLTGSELLIIEPEQMVWDQTQQDYPFVFESIGDWDVTVTIEPPDGFVADEGSLTEEVDNEYAAVQFTITEVGSDLVPTKTTFDVLHNGRIRVVKSRVGIMLTEPYARSRGFDPVVLRKRGLIKELNTAKPSLSR